MSKSRDAFERAQRVLVGGVNSPVRAFAAVGGGPVFVASGKGARITDLDGNSYLDYVGSWGPLILGHAHEGVVEAICAAARDGASFGIPTQRETELAELILSALPGAERIRFVNSGTEAVMTAIRLARGVTRRDKIVKFIGCYHGHSDALLVSAGSGAMTLGVPSSPGVPGATTSDTLLLPYNDVEMARATFAQLGRQIAAVIVEPVAGNMGVVGPVEGFLETLRELCDQWESVLIFDEVMTGFRVAWGGAQGRLGVRPDLTALGKVIGGGLPVGAVAGGAETMEQLAPTGPVYQAGTLSGNPVAMAAGLATLRECARDGFYDVLEQRAGTLEAALVAQAAEAGFDDRLCVQRVGSMLTCFFHPGPVRDYRQASACDVQSFGVFFQTMLEQGVYLPPSQFEAWFVSAAHEDSDIQRTAQAVVVALHRVAEVMQNAREDR